MAVRVESRSLPRVVGTRRSLSRAGRRRRTEARWVSVDLVFPVELLALVDLRSDRAQGGRVRDRDRVDLRGKVRVKVDEADEEAEEVLSKDRVRTGNSRPIIRSKENTKRK